MSFGPSQQTKNATAQNAQIATQAVNNSADQIGQGTNLLNSGAGSVQSGTNFFNTLLNGNRANTTALLQPNIDQIRDSNTNSLNAISNLSPRGGGRSSTLFGAAYAPTQQINSLYNGMRGTAGGNLAQIGLQQEGMGTNLMQAGNSALNTGSQTNTGLMNYGLEQQKQSNALWSGLGQGLFGLATVPFGNFGAIAGKGGTPTSLLGRIGI
jgi:hypothetical protein